jgi:putative chitinase
LGLFDLFRQPTNSAVPLLSPSETLDVGLKTDIFFKEVRVKPFGGHLSQPQVDGMNSILVVWNKSYRLQTSITQLGGCLGTAFHETSQTMKPIHEYGSVQYFTRMYDITGSRLSVAKRLGNIRKGDGAKFAGRGYVQLTGRANYRKATLELRKMGILSEAENLETNPDLAMRPDVAAAVMFSGMIEGWFTGISLDDVIDNEIDGDEFQDYVRARRIINGQDRATLIAGYSMAFLSALRKAL